MIRDYRDLRGAIIRKIRCVSKRYKYGYVPGAVMELSEVRPPVECNDPN